MSSPERALFPRGPFKPYRRTAPSLSRLKQGLGPARGHSLYVAEVGGRPDSGGVFPCPAQHTSSGHCWSASRAGLRHGSDLEVDLSPTW